MNASHVLITAVFLTGCSGMCINEATIPKETAAMLAWSVMESIPVESTPIVKMMEEGKLKVEFSESEGRKIWQVTHSNNPPPGTFVKHERHSDVAIAGGGTGFWSAGVDAITGDIVWKRIQMLR